MASALQIVPAPLRLNLGCSDSHMKNVVNVDRVPPADLIADLSVFPWPWESGSVDLIYAWDFLEHLPDKLVTLNEVHRVLKPGGRLDFVVPTTDGRGAFQDPTHKSFWTPNDVFYWCDQFAEWQRFHVAYGISARFHLISVDHQEYQSKVWKLHAILEAR